MDWGSNNLSGCLFIFVCINLVLFIHTLIGDVTENAVYTFGVFCGPVRVWPGFYPPPFISVCLYFTIIDPYSRPNQPYIVVEIGHDLNQLAAICRDSDFVGVIDFFFFQNTWTTWSTKTDHGKHDLSIITHYFVIIYWFLLWQVWTFFITVNNLTNVKGI